jgi:hypothetical protein
MHSSAFDFDVITGPSVPTDRKPETPSPAPAQPAAQKPPPQRSR